MDIIQNVCVIVCMLSLLHTSWADTTESYYNFADVDTTDRNRSPVLCADIRPQHLLDIEQIMGRWYGNEIIMHTQDMPGVYHYDSCVNIQISDITDQMRANGFNNRRYASTATQQYGRNGPQADSMDYNTQYLRLVWTEAKNTLEYTFNYTTYGQGIWTSMGDQHVSFHTDSQYTQFRGTVQVVKAVSDHLVLTFCNSDQSGSVYTIVLSRTTDGLSGKELRSIHRLLGSRGLSTESVRKVCSTASGLKKSAPLLVLLAIISIIRKHC